MQIRCIGLGSTPAGIIQSVRIPGGPALKGTDYPVFPGDGESPLRTNTIAPFDITATAITNYQFSAFVQDTGYRTEAERFGWSFVYKDALRNREFVAGQVLDAHWWCKVSNAYWREPIGPESRIAHFDALPVVHVSHNDAAAFAQWAGGRLPTEAEWEHAARGGLSDVRYPWGNDDPSYHDAKCHFGQLNRPELKPEAIGPVAADAFPPNGYGLYNMVGNVWEWTSSDVDNWHADNASPLPCKLLKGGSYLCHPEVCFRYRICARISNSIDTSTGHTGFRIVFS